MKLNSYIILYLFAVVIPTTGMSQEFTPGKLYLAPGRSPELTSYTLNVNASGVIQTINNIVNLTVASRDANDLKAEYRARFIQGKLQGKSIISARDNAWDNAYPTNPWHTFPKHQMPHRSIAGDYVVKYERPDRAILSYTADLADLGVY